VSCRVVCISRAFGAGGEEVGRLVAERLGFLYVDDEIVTQAAIRGGVDPAGVADEERRKTVVARVLDALAQGSAEVWPPGGGGMGEELRSEGIRALIRETIEQTAARGDVVIVAHAASHVVSGRPALRVLVTASPRTRAQRVGDQDGLDEARAARAVKESDAARRDYLKRFYGVDEELPTHYDLVVNTDVLSPEDAAAVVSRAAEL
jgi:cytidylate kinase